MITNTEFKKALTDRTLDLSKADLERILDEELGKPESEIDTDLIEFCLDELGNADKKIAEIADGKGGAENKKRSFGKFFAAVAAAAVLIFGSLTAYASISGVGIAEGLVELYEKYIVVRFDSVADESRDYELLGSELAQSLEKNGISPVLLPEALLSKEAKIKDIQYQVGEAHISANISFKYGWDKGYVSIVSVSVDSMIGESQFPNGKRVCQLEISGIPVFVIEQNGEGNIYYRDGQTEYSIVTSMSFEKAVEFAETIK